MEHGKGGFSCHAGHLRAVTLREPALRHELIIFIVSTKGAGRTIYGEEFMEQGRTDII
jgi:hypothetical protein